MGGDGPSVGGARAGISRRAGALRSSGPAVCRLVDRRAALGQSQVPQHTGWIEIDVIQPVLVAMAIAYAALLRSLGIEPDAVVGHSMGEVAAACIAGVLDLDQAMQHHLPAQRADAAHQRSRRDGAG